MRRSAPSDDRRSSCTTSPTRARLARIHANPTVTFHLDSYGRDGDCLVIAGTASISTDVPLADRNAAFMYKYMTRVSSGWGRVGPGASPWRYLAARIPRPSRDVIRVCT